MLDLSPEKALIFRITHIDNVPWLLTNGIHCRNSPTPCPNFREIGNSELIGKRASRTVPIPPGGTLSDYVPFYFTPCSPMLLNIKTGYNGVTMCPMSDIVILVSSLPKLVEKGLPFLFTDRHAYLEMAQFTNDLGRLGEIDWPLLRAKDFMRDPNRPDKFERYQAEALVYGSVPVDALLGIGCFNDGVAEKVRGIAETSGVICKTAARTNWYF